MATVPTTNLGKIEFYESHLPAWGTNAVAIGITAAAAANLATLTTAARSAYNAHVTATAAARAATANFYDKVAAMHAGPGAGADMIRTIRAFAQSTNNPNVYVLAQIPPPATPGVVPPPGTPFDFRVGLLQSGAIDLRWKCTNPPGASGTVYEVMRRVGSEPFVYMDSPGVRQFTDSTVPSGSGTVTYRVTAVRSTTRGNPAQFTVQFGTDAEGVTITSVTGEGTTVKMAA
ncbi:MAG: hypothetical protein DYG94_13465 [Leptolyngbya sp. PLA3]|nr:MAG: hypothetical protein EDM82_14020 [Cyanobacteria bacterium CYA]MCE7969734.1 hypothetical protein [Leptolyngbya sp. PL-A3]